MDQQIEISAANEKALNRLIDEKLKAGYLLINGITSGEDGLFYQKMRLSNPIDEEFTLAGGVKLVIMLVILGSITYFMP